MDTDDLEPRKKPEFRPGGDLSDLSIEELNDLAGALAEEIARIETAVRAKEATRDAAASVFKS